ncbi:MAG: amidohydrolase [Syntrophobacterales bacterium]|jgi:5-methylthioadenosine/S-adenosylhomocysteine deaminase
MFDTLIHSALVLTLEPPSDPIPRDYVAIKDGKVATLGQVQKEADLPPARERLDVGGSLVLPGLVNTHCHAPMVWFRGLADDLPLQVWLTQKIFPVESGWLDRDKVYWGSLLAAAEMIRGGITTVADGYFYEDEVRRAFKHAGLRAVVAQGLVDFPFPGVPNPQDNLTNAARFVETGADDAELITSTVLCHTPYTCGPQTLKGAKALSRSRGLPFFIHLAETRQEVEELKAKTGMGPAAYLDSLGLLDELTVVVHAVWLEPADIEIFAGRDVKVSHCPESNLKLAAGVAPVPELLARGVTVGLGTDGAASNNNLDLFGEMSLTARLHKVWQGDPTVLPAPEVVALATREGARVLGLEDRVGTLSPGKQADLIVVDLNQAHLTPLYDPYSHLVYAARSADVRHVMVAGRWLLKDRRFLTLDWGDLATRARDYARDLADFIGPLQKM